MTSSVGGRRGSPKSRRKKQNQLICDNDRGRGQKIRKFCAHHIWKPPQTDFMRPQARASERGLSSSQAPVRLSLDID